MLPWLMTRRLCSLPDVAPWQCGARLQKICAKLRSHLGRDATLRHSELPYSSAVDEDDPAVNLATDVLERWGAGGTRRAQAVAIRSIVACAMVSAQCPGHGVKWLSPRWAFMRGWSAARAATVRTLRSVVAHAGQRAASSYAGAWDGQLNVCVSSIKHET